MKAWRIVNIVCILSAAAATEVFLVLCLLFYRAELSPALYDLILIGGTVLNVALGAVEIVFYFLHKSINRASSPIF